MIKTTIGQMLQSDLPLARIMLKTDEDGHLIISKDGQFVQRELPASLAYDLGMLRRAMAPHLEEYAAVEAEKAKAAREKIAALGPAGDEGASDEQKSEIAEASGKIVAAVNKELFDLQGREVDLEHSKKLKLAQLSKAGVTIGVYDMEALMWLLEV